MLYLTAISVIFFLSFPIVVTGRNVAALLPTSFKKIASFYTAPLLGLALFVLLTTFYGWLLPFKFRYILPFTFVFTLAGIYLEEDRGDLIKHWITVSGFSLLATTTLFATALIYDSFNPCNDTFTYLVHGQWLQSHPYSEHVHLSGYYAATTQIGLYQISGLRMGASFFLAFVQSLFHLQWSYYAYLPALGIALAVGSLALGGLIQQVIPISRKVCLSLCLLPAFTMNGFLIGAQLGFYPQTFGLAFATGLACLIPGLLTTFFTEKTSLGKIFIQMIPLSLCSAALLLAYNDFFPVFSLCIGLFILVTCLLYWQQKKQLLVIILIWALQVALLANFEWLRIIKNIFSVDFSASTGTVRFGWPVLWSPIQFAAMSFGMKSPFDEHLTTVLLLDNIISKIIFPIIFILVVFTIIKLLRKKPKSLPLIFLMCVNAIFFILFIKFRYFTPSVNEEVGFTFLQFKLAKWLTPFNLGLLAIVFSWFFLTFKKLQRIAVCLYFALFISGVLLQSILFSRVFLSQFRNETMHPYSPFTMLLDLRARVANIPNNEVIYLDLDNDYQKLQQMIVYILYDRKIAANFEKDDYISGYLPPEEKNIAVEKAKWYLQWQPIVNSNENPLFRSGPFLIHSAPFSFFSLVSIDGAYNTEIAANKQWNWVKDTVSYRFRHVGAIDRSKVTFQYQSTGPLTLQINTITNKLIISFNLPTHTELTSYVSPLIATHSQDIVVEIIAHGHPVRLSPSDSRETQFLIQNLVLESVHVN